MTLFKGRARSRKLVESLQAVQPHGVVLDWLSTQSATRTDRYEDLRLLHGGGSPDVIERRLAEQGWNLTGELMTALVDSIATAPEYHLDENGDGYMVVLGERYDVKSFTRSQITISES